VENVSCNLVAWELGANRVLVEVILYIYGDGDGTVVSYWTVYEQSSFKGCLSLFPQKVIYIQRKQPAWNWSDFFDMPNTVPNILTVEN
jgi:hypothetical protein